MRRPTERPMVRVRVRVRVRAKVRVRVRVRGRVRVGVRVRVRVRVRPGPGLRLGFQRPTERPAPSLRSSTVSSSNVTGGNFTCSSPCRSDEWIATDLG